MKKGRTSEQLASAGSEMDILLVEDDARDAELTLNALEQCGFAQRVVHVNDGTEALDFIACAGSFAHRHPPIQPKLILLDLGLNKMGGLHVLRHLKSDERTRGIPVVVLTSSVVAIQLVESYRLGVNSYVIKPTDARRFAETVAGIGHYWLKLNEPPPR